MRPRVALSFLVLAVPVGCDDKPAGSAGTPSGNPAKVMTVEDTDSEMTAAMAKARASLPEFIAAVRAPKPTQSAFTIKAPFKDGDQTEYMSVTPVTFDGKAFQGTLDDEPVALRNVKLGDKVMIEPGRVADWSYVEDGKLAGGYTLRVLRERMTPEQRRQYDRGRQFRIE